MNLIASGSVMIVSAGSSLLAFAALLETASGKPAKSGASNANRRVARRSPATKLDADSCSRMVLRSIAALLAALNLSIRRSAACLVLPRSVRAQT
jgi:hypothetical protein